MNDLVNSFAYWLADFYLATTVLLAAAHSAIYACRQPAKRLAIVKATVVAVAMLAALCALPGWSIVSLAGSEAEPAVGFAPEVGPPPGVTLVEPPRAMEPFSVVHAEAAPTQGAAIPVAATWEIPWLSLVVVAYLLGSTAIVFWLVAGAIAAARLVQRAEAAPAALWETIESTGGLARLRISREIDVPVALRVWRPCVLLPREWVDARSARELATVLAHEAAHIRHGDLKWLAASRLLLVALWAQPLYWWLRRQMRLDQETLADAAAAELSSRTTYAEQLVAWARAMPPRSRPALASAVGLWEGPSQLRRRIALLVDERMTILRRCPLRWAVASVALMSVLAASLSLATFEPANTEAAPARIESSKPRAGIGILPSGIRVEMLAVGVGGESAADDAWWLPDGTPLVSFPYRVGSGSVTPDDDQVERQFVMRVPDLPHGATVRWQIVDQVGGSFLGEILPAGEKKSADVALPNCYSTGFCVLNDQRYFDLQVRVATGEWRTILDSRPDGGGAHGLVGGKSVSFTQAFSLSAPHWGESTAAVVSHNFADQDVRVVAVDKAGERHTAGKSSATSTGQTDSVLAQFDFLGLKRADVAKFEFQTRDFESVRLSRIAAQPDADRNAAPFTAFDSGDTAVAKREAESSENSIDEGRSNRGDELTLPDRVIEGDRYVLCRVTTDLQRSLLGDSGEPVADASACLIVNAAAFAEEPLDQDSSALKELSTRLATWAKVDDRRLISSVIFRPSSDSEESNKSREAAYALAKHLETLGTAAGFQRVRWSVTHLGDLSFEWGKSIENATSLAKDAPTDSEQGIGDARVEVFAVRTFLSHLLVNADCVVNIMSIIDEPEAKSFPREFEHTMSEFVPRLEYGRRDTMLFRVRSALSMRERLDDWVNDRQGRELFAASLGFKTCNLQTSYVAESDAEPKKRSEDKVETQHQSTGGGAVTRFVAGNPATPWDYKPNVLSLAVQDEGGKPIEGVEAWVIPTSPTSGERRVVQRATTNAEGKVEFDGLVDSDRAATLQELQAKSQFPLTQGDIFYVVLRQEGRAMVILAASDFTLAGRGVKRSVRMRPGAELSGRVTDRDGKPVAGATVAAGGLAGTFMLEGSNAVKTNANGRYRFPNLVAFNREAANKRIAEQNQWALGADRDLSKMYPEMYDSAEDTSVSDMVVTHPDYAVTTVPGGDVPGTTDVVMLPAAAIEGRVIEFGSGKPVTGVMVKTVGQVASAESAAMFWQAGTSGPAAGSMHSATTRTDAAGRYQLNNLPAGHYDVWAQEVDGEFATADWLCRGIKELVVDPMTTPTTAADLVVGPGAEIHGQLVDASTGKPLSVGEGAVVQAVGTFVGGPNQQTLPVQKVPVTADGKFEIRAYPGRQRIFLMVEQGVQDGRPHIILRSSDDAMQSGRVFDLKHGEAVQADIPVWPARLMRELREAIRQGFDLLQAKSEQQAIDAFTTAIQISPDNSSALGGRVQAYERSGQFAEAINDYERLIALEPDNFMWRNNLAHIMATSPTDTDRDGPLAVELAERAVALAREAYANSTTTTVVDMLDTLAAAQAEVGDFAAAVTTQREAIEKSPEQRRGEFRMRLKLYESGKPYRRPSAARE